MTTAGLSGAELLSETEPLQWHRERSHYRREALMMAERQIAVTKMIGAAKTIRKYPFGLEITALLNKELSSVRVALDAAITSLKVVESNSPKRKELSEAVRNAVFSKTGGVCIYCGKPAATVDHVRAFSEGGSDDIENLVPACRGCNSKKGFKHYKSFIQTII